MVSHLSQHLHRQIVFLCWVGRENENNTANLFLLFLKTSLQLAYFFVLIEIHCNVVCYGRGCVSENRDLRAEHLISPLKYFHIFLVTLPSTSSVGFFFCLLFRRRTTLLIIIKNVCAFYYPDSYDCPPHNTTVGFHCTFYRTRRFIILPFQLILFSLVFLISLPLAVTPLCSSGIVIVLLIIMFCIIRVTVVGSDSDFTFSSCM